MTDHYLANLRAAFPEARFGANENDLGVYEVWIKTRSGALGYASGTSLVAAIERLHNRLIPMHEAPK